MTFSAVCATTVCFSRYRYTGKERDTESGNDYFGARYYASSMGRFMSPDWSAQASPVPYAVMGDPQSLNLYSYVRNNPLSRRDLDGHCWTGELTCGAALDTSWATTRLHNETTITVYAHQSFWSRVGSWFKGGGVALSAVLFPKTYQTYSMYNPTTDQTYSGRTSGTGTPEENVASRGYDHHILKQGVLPPVLDQSSDDSNAIRGREQQLIWLNGGAQSEEGGTSGNAINGISPSNPKFWDYLGAAMKQFGATFQKVTSDPNLQESNRLGELAHQEEDGDTDEK